jgi:hypothetical protein
MNDDAVLERAVHGELMTEQKCKTDRVKREDVPRDSGIQD